jgi:hypothetical protein
MVEAGAPVEQHGEPDRLGEEHVRQAVAVVVGDDRRFTGPFECGSRAQRQRTGSVSVEDIGFVRDHVDVAVEVHVADADVVDEAVGLLQRCPIRDAIRESSSRQCQPDLRPRARGFTP